MKSLPEIKKGFTFAPRESGSSLRDWQAGKKRGMRISLKKTSQKACGIEKGFLLLHPLPETRKRN